MSDTNGPDPTDSPPGLPGNAAERIIERFGGIRPMASKVEVPVTTVQGWKKRGAIPSNRHPDLIAAAARHNIALDPAELEAAAPADERGADPAHEPVEPEAVAVPLDIGNFPDPDGRPADARDPDAAPGATSRDPAAGAPAGEGEEHHPALSEAALEPASTTSGTTPGGTRATAGVYDGPAQRRGGGGLAATALVLSLVALAGAATSPWWAPGLLGPVLGSPDRGGGDLERRVADLDQRLQQLANRPATPTPPAVAGAPGTDGSAFERRIAEIEQRLQGGTAGTPAPDAATPAPSPAEGSGEEIARRVDALEERIQQVASAPSADGSGEEIARRIDALEQRVQQVASAPPPPPDTRVQEQVGQLDQRLDQLAQSLQQVQGSGGQVGSQVASLTQELAQLRERTQQLAQDLSQRRNAEARAEALAMAAAQVRAATQTSQPFGEEVQAMRGLGADDPAVGQAIETLSAHAQSGVPSRARLAERFSQLSGDIARAGAVGDEGSWTDQALSKVNALISIRRPAGEAQGDGPSAVVSRAEARLDEGDLKGAVDELSTLQGPAAETARPWLDDARARLAVDEAAAALTNAAVSRLSGSSGSGGSGPGSADAGSGASSATSQQGASQ
jgi:hypothetical protein